MLLTIIIPSFQLGHEMAGALESIRNQHFFNYEIVIADGGSTDSTSDVVAASMDLPIRFVQEHDTGVYDAMNKGIRQAKGEWIYFMGADDRLYENVLNNIKKLFDRADLDIFYGDVIMTNDKNRYDGYFDLSKLLCVGNICHQAIFYRKSVFDRLGDYNLKYKIWADWDFNIRCFEHNKLVIEYFNTIIAYYNNSSGVSAVPDKVFLKQLPAYYIGEINELKSKLNNLSNSKLLKLDIKIASWLSRLRSSK